MGNPQMLCQRVFLPPPSLGQLSRVECRFSISSMIWICLTSRQVLLLSPRECVVLADLLGWQGEEMGSHNLMISGEVAIRGPVRDMFPVSKCMGYIGFLEPY